VPEPEHVSQLDSLPVQDESEYTNDAPIGSLKELNVPGDEEEEEEEEIEPRARSEAEEEDVIESADGNAYQPPPLDNEADGVDGSFSEEEEEEKAKMPSSGSGVPLKRPAEAPSGDDGGE
jgi:hypothetical protein